MSDQTKFDARAASAPAVRPLPVLRTSHSGASCPRTELLWDEEIELIRRLGEIGREARMARDRDPSADVSVLRAQFRTVRERMEALRRQRLDSLGFFQYE